MKISIIVAMDKLGAIGKEGDLPWRLGTDLKKFKQITMGKPIIMGRKTYESIGKPLPGRKNIVMTTKSNYLKKEIEFDNLEYVKNPEDAIDAAGSVDEVMIIGGGEIYKLFLEKSTDFYITHVHTTIEDPDVYFPSLNKDKLITIEKIEFQKSDIDEFDFTFYHYRLN
tara:strand:+ start:438 stop:941 length:504 start_codon:yes stop_codon:yes gene_type:complete